MSDWQTIDCTGAPHARHENGFAELGGKFFVFGGRRIQPVDVFDPATGEWSHCSPPPMEIHHFQPVIIGEEVWLSGTMTGVFPRETPLETVFIYTPATDTWREGPELQRARHGTNALVYDDAMWIAVGSGARGGVPELTSIERFRP